jgi:hypothetical protein
LDDRTLADLIPAIAENIEGVYDFRTIQPPTPEVGHGEMFTMRYGDALAVVMLQTPAKLMITAGVAVDVDWTPQLLAQINELNASTVIVGRLFGKQLEGKGQRTGIILLQEMLECQDLDSGPSVNVLLRVCGRVMGIANRVSDDLCRRHDGHPPHPDSWPQIANYAA